MSFGRHMNIHRTTIVCECCDQEKPWSERCEDYIWIDICDDCETDFSIAEKAHETNGGSY